MKFYSFQLLLISSLLLCSCSGSELLQHPSKNLTDLHVDDVQCASIAQAQAKEQSLVKQANISVLQHAYGQCMASQGWTPVVSEQQVLPQAEPVAITATETSIKFITKQRQLELQGQVKLISQDQSGALFQQDERFIYLNLQDQSPFTFLSIYPPMSPSATLFDKYQQENTRATFYYQEVDKKLIFGGIAYILLDKHSRIVVSITQELFDMPEDFMEISQLKYDQLLSLQANWSGLFNDIQEQSSSTH